MYGKRNTTGRKTPARTYRLSAYRPNMGRTSMYNRAAKNKSSPTVAAPKFAVRGYAVDVEKKYSDSSYSYHDWTFIPMTYRDPTGTDIFIGAKGECVPLISNTQNLTPGGTNLLANVNNGATVTDRLGNKVTGVYLELGGVLEAAKSSLEQGGEVDTIIPEDGGFGRRNYYKTAYRVVLVKDKQVNNPTNTVRWNDVFGWRSGAANNNTFATTDILNISNMGRFTIVKDLTFQLDGDDPMKTFKFTHWLNHDVRYNATGVNALTDVGYHLLIAQDILGASGAQFNLGGHARVSSRYCFTDA